jgi:SAM-dependent methyltransferase
MTERLSKSSELAAAYEGLEDPRSFPDASSLDRYRAGLLSRTGPQADFLAERIRPEARVLEIGCGNGRLLIELARRGAVEAGIGLDLAASRIEFARSWARSMGVDGLHFEVADVLEQGLPSGPFAAICCITGAFAYFEAAALGTAVELTRGITRALEPAGLLCLEIYPHPQHKRLLEASGGKVRIWSELPEDDPWQFYLSELSLDATGGVLTHEKTFVHRTDRRIDSGRHERLYLYTEETLMELLLDAGFETVRAYEGWSAEPYAGGEVMVVTAVTPSPR